MGSDHTHRRTRHTQRSRTLLLYAWALLNEFRATLAAVSAVVLVGAVAYWLTPQGALNNARPSLLVSLYAAWMAMLAQPAFGPPQPWYLIVLCGLYPLLGFVLVGEGVVRLALLMISRRAGEKEWMRVMASTFRDHVVLCGLGHLGARVLEQLVAADMPVVCIEKDENGRFVAAAKALNVPVLFRDMKDDQSLIDAGIPHARAVIIATNDDMANLEVALDSRRMNPRIRVIMRLFDQQIASKIADAMMVDKAFSSSALAAPIVAAMSLDTSVLSSYVISGTQYVVATMQIEEASPLADQAVGDVEQRYGIHVVAVNPGAAEPSAKAMPHAIFGRDRIVIHAPAARLSAIAAASRNPPLAAAVQA